MGPGACKPEPGNCTRTWLVSPERRNCRTDEAMVTTPSYTYNPISPVWTPRLVLVSVRVMYVSVPFDTVSGWLIE